MDPSAAFLLILNQAHMTSLLQLLLFSPRYLFDQSNSLFLNYFDVENI